MTATVLVTGATGKQGFATARHLLAARAQVHALVRNPSSPASLELAQLGAKICPGTFNDLDSLEAAAIGTTAVFLNVMPTIKEPELELHHAKNIIQAAKEAGTVTSIIYSSVVMAGKHESFPNWSPDYPSGWYWTSKAAIESTVRSAGFAQWTILRPAFLMGNYLSPAADFMFPDLPKRHTFLTAYKPENAMTVCDPDDVGKFAAAAFLEPKMYNHQEIDLGVEALTPKEITRSLSKASGKEIKTEFYPDEEAAALAEANPVVRAQLWANEVGYNMDFEVLKKYPIKLTTFDGYLQREKELVHNTFG